MKRNGATRISASEPPATNCARAVQGHAPRPMPAASEWHNPPEAGPHMHPSPQEDTQTGQ
eukprot:14180158-Alexandrium_andersonii.AAC.1